MIWKYLIVIILIENVPVVQCQRCTSGKQDIVFVVDSSGSIRDNNPADQSYDNWQLTLNFINDFIDRLEIGTSQTQVGMVIFGSEGENVFTLNQYGDKSSLKAAVRDVEYLGQNTNTSGGIKVMRSQQFVTSAGDRSDADDISIIITDGVSTYDKEQTIPQAEAARQENIKVFVIGVTNAIDEDEIRAMSSMPQQEGENYWSEADFTSLNSVIDTLQRATECASTTSTTQEPTTTTATTTMATTTTTQAPTQPSCYRGKEDIIFVVDSSGSIRDNNPTNGAYDNWSLLLQFIADFVQAMDVGPAAVNVGVVLYSNQARVPFRLGDYMDKQDVINEILNLEYIGGFTNTSGALRVMHTEMFYGLNGVSWRPDAEDVAIMITDGFSTLDEDKTLQEADIAIQKGIRLYSIGITDVVDINELRGMSSPPQQINRNYWMAPDFTVLNTVLDSIISNECGTPPSIPPTTNCLSGNGADLVIMVDTSESIGFDNWEKMIEFLQNLISQLDIGPDAYQVGIVPFSDVASVRFHLNQYSSRNDVIQAIDDIYYDQGSTNIASALQTTREDMFTRRNGDRYNVPNIGILITDGEAKVREGDTIPEANLAKMDGIILMTVGVTSGVKMDQLLEIASLPEYFLSFNSFDTLTSGVMSILDVFCREVQPVDVCPDRACKEEYGCQFENAILECPCGPEDWDSKYCQRKYPAEQQPLCMSTSQREDRPMGYTYPIVDALCGTQGADVGGTDVFIWGEGFEGHQNAAVTVGRFDCHILESNTTYLHCVTSPGDSPNGALPVSVQLPNTNPIVEPEAFTYLPNPSITSIMPIKAILGGGIKLTVDGKNLNSVQAPILEVTLLFTPNPDNATSALFTSLCTIDSATRLYCLSPEISLPYNYNSNISERSKRSNEDRRKRATADTGLSNTDANMFNRNNILQFYIGMKLDGLQTYRRLITLNPDMANLAVFPNPEIDDIDGDERTVVFRPGWPFDQDQLVLKGSRLDWGASIGDYTVRVGDSECVVFSLNSTTLVCTPPTESKPKPTADEDKLPRIEVTVGNLRFTPGSMKYEMNIWEYPEGMWSIIAILVFLFILIIMIIICVVCSKRRKKYNEMQHYRKIAPLSTAPDGYLSPTCSIFDVIDDDLSTKVNTAIFDSQKMTLGVVIKKGQFGVVYVGWLLDGPKERRRTSQIQIKTARHPVPTISDVSNFLEEATILKGYDHPNVVPLTGVSIINNLPFVITPLMENSDLRTFLRRKDTAITVRGLLKFCKEVAMGMSYLAEHQFVHTDLAARNCMVSRDLIVKIGDPGLAYDISPQDYLHTTSKQRPLPIKWMSPESLDSGVFTTRSDVWSFGITMWEILTRGMNPYNKVHFLDMRRLLRSNRRLKRPDTCPDEVYKLMKSCWTSDALFRPDFEFGVATIEDSVATMPLQLDEHNPIYYDISPLYSPYSTVEAYSRKAGTAKTTLSMAYGFNELPYATLPTPATAQDNSNRGMAGNDRVKERGVGDRARNESILNGQGNNFEGIYSVVAKNMVMGDKKYTNTVTSHSKSVYNGSTLSRR